MSARVYGDTLVLLTDGRAFEVFVAPVSGLAAASAAGLRFEKASSTFLAPYTYAHLPKDYVATALRVLPRSGEPRSCGISQSTGGLSFVVYPVKTEDAAATFAPRSYWRFSNSSDFSLRCAVFGRRTASKGGGSVASMAVAPRVAEACSDEHGSL